MHWNGDLLDTLATGLKFAQTMTWRGNSPTVTLITKTYQTGVKPAQKTMNKLEKLVDRLPMLGKWFVDIYPI